jgi:hypothetical protein
VVTLFAVVLGWVIFRAPTFEAAWLILRGMFGMNGTVLSAAFEPLLSPLMPLLENFGVSFGHTPLFFGSPQAWGVVFLLAIALLAPNSHQLLGYHQTLEPDRSRTGRSGVQTPASPARLRWAPSRGWAVAVGIMFVYLLTQLSNVSEFLYFQF